MSESQANEEEGIRMAWQRTESLDGFPEQMTFATRRDGRGYVVGQPREGESCGQRQQGRAPEGCRRVGHGQQQGGERRTDQHAHGIHEAAHDVGARQLER